MRTRRSASSSSNSVSSSPHNAAATETHPGSTDSEGHVPVLLQEVLQSLAPDASDTVVDATLGGGGHARELVKKLGAGGTFIGIDADGAALTRARSIFSNHGPPTIHLVQSNFRHLNDVLSSLGISKINKALFDLGWSSYQLTAGRGFSFLADEPLLMTYADSPRPHALTAEIAVNTWAEKSLADVIYGWGEERNARRIARAIVETRGKTPVRTSRQLAEIIEQVVPRKGKIHPATRTFQALRIAVNDEFGAIREGLNAAWQHLVPGGRIAVITFHSIEDREVKMVTREWEKNDEAKRLTKSPIVPSREEMRTNPRARSAKLRVLEKTE